MFANGGPAEQLPLKRVASILLWVFIPTGNPPLGIGPGGATSPQITMPSWPENWSMLGASLRYAQYSPGPLARTMAAKGLSSWFILR